MHSQCWSTQEQAVLKEALVDCPRDLYCLALYPTVSELAFWYGSMLDIILLLLSTHESLTHPLLSQNCCYYSQWIAAPSPTKLFWTFRDETLEWTSLSGQVCPKEDNSMWNQPRHHTIPTQWHSFCCHTIAVIAFEGLLVHVQLQPRYFGLFQDEISEWWPLSVCIELYNWMWNQAWRHPRTHRHSHCFWQDQRWFQLIVSPS